LFEQTTGQACDYFMLILYLIRYFQTNIPEEKEMFMHGAKASAWHFGQIYTLIVVGLGAKGNLAIAMEWILIFSVTPTFYHNLCFAWEWDRRVWALNNGKTTLPILDNSPDGLHVTSSAAASSPPRPSDAPTPASPSEAKNDDIGKMSVSGTEKIPDPRKDLGAHIVVPLLICSFIFSALVILLPGLLPHCPLDNPIFTASDVARIRELPMCMDQTSVTRLTVIEGKPYIGGALQQALRPLVPIARANPKNLRYELLSGTTIVAGGENKFAIVQQWPDELSMTTHDSSFHVENILESLFVRRLTQSTTVYGPFRSNENCTAAQAAQNLEEQPVILAFTWTIKQNVDTCWGLLNDWGNARWVQGVVQVILETPENPAIRRLYLPNGDYMRVRLDSAVAVGAGYRLVYTILETVTPHPLLDTYQGTIDIQPFNNTVTEATYGSVFYPTNPLLREQVRGFVNYDFTVNRIPFLIKLFESL
jgi:quinol monooxygenase YgiN